MEVETMLMRTDPFRDLDRLTQQAFGTPGTTARPSAVPMDAWRDGDRFIVEFDLPGVEPSSIDLDVERNVVTIRAERAARERRGTDRRRAASRRLLTSADPR
ncbi:MAG: 18 kDa antigen 2 [Jatrophihabitans sp.]|nr:18 kDa antigen 2 [Jatrophihabitans sp.]